MPKSRKGKRSTQKKTVENVKNLSKDDPATYKDNAKEISPDSDMPEKSEHYQQHSTVTDEPIPQTEEVEMTSQMVKPKEQMEGVSRASEATGPKGRGRGRGRGRMRKEITPPNPGVSSPTQVFGGARPKTQYQTAEISPGYSNNESMQPVICAPDSAKMSIPVPTESIEQLSQQVKPVTCAPDSGKRSIPVPTESLEQLSQQVKPITCAPDSGKRSIPVPTESIEKLSQQVSKLSTDSIGQEPLKEPPLELPRRNGRVGTVGRKIALRANHFSLKFKMSGYLHHYDVSISPSKILPKRRNRQIIEKMLDSYSVIFEKERPVYDGSKNIYTKEPLPFNEQEETFSIDLNDGGKRTQRFKITMKWVNQVSLDDLKDYLDGKTSSIQSTINILDTVFHQLPTMSYVPIGRSFYPKPANGGYDLEGGKTTWHGFFQSVRPQWKEFSLVLNNSTTAFYKEENVVDFIYEVLRLGDQHLTRPLSPRDIDTLQSELAGVHIESSYAGKRKRAIKRITKKPAKTLTFPMEENGTQKECTVERYFMQKYNINLRHPFLPCIQFGDLSRHQFIPVELCNILSGQKSRKKLTDYQTAKMIKHAAIPAPERKKKIEEWIKRRDFENDPYLKNFEITVSQEMKKVDGRVLPSPRIEYSPGNRNKDCKMTPRNGSWNIGDGHYLTPCSIKSWAIVSFAERTPEGLIKTLSDRLTTIMRSRGIEMNNPSIHHNHRSNISAALHKLKQNYPDIELFFIVIAPRKEDYELVKQICSNKLGVMTQCMQEKNVKKALESAPFLNNICLKLNSKLGGVNSSVIREGNDVVRRLIFHQPVIIMGADVTHPAAGDYFRPSIAAVVGSLDGKPFKFKAEVRVQKHRQEYIQDLECMTKKLLIQFFKATNHKPQRIVFYRDGVSEGQFMEILVREVDAIRKACTSLQQDYKPGITFLVVQKRHQTRLFCEYQRDQVGRAGNVPPGTCVDTEITHPFNYDYYLCSHEGLMGTSKPAHYFPLWDDNDLGADVLQQLTNQLCYSYSNCTRSVSIPAPAYYAHKAAFMARVHVEQVFRNNPDASCDENGYPTPEMADAVNVSENLKNSMHFI